MEHRVCASGLPRLGLIGFGAFGQLIARHLRHHFRILAHDPAADSLPIDSVDLVGIAEAAACPFVILAVPVDRLADAVDRIAPHVKPGALIFDVGSVKMMPAQILAQRLPDHVNIIATHPLFGPQSTRNGLAGQKIVLCPLRGERTRRTIAFLRHHLGLEVILTTPEAHDRETALSQGLTHLIAQMIIGMGPLPAEITTRSFGLLMEAVDMVRHDAPEIGATIARDNPFSADVRQRFLNLAQAVMP